MAAIVNSNAMSVIGPMPAPPALLECVSEARAGVPLLLVGGGSGIVPLVAILRRLVHGKHELPQSARVHLVLVVREVSALEQMRDRREQLLVLDCDGRIRASALLVQAWEEREGALQAAVDASAKALEQCQKQCVSIRVFCV